MCNSPRLSPPACAYRGSAKGAGKGTSPPRGSASLGQGQARGRGECGCIDISFVTHGEGRHDGTVHRRKEKKKRSIVSPWHWGKMKRKKKIKKEKKSKTVESGRANGRMLTFFFLRGLSCSLQTNRDRGVKETTFCLHLDPPTTSMSQLLSAVAGGVRRESEIEERQDETDQASLY